jgi:hypothetical protein
MKDIVEFGGREEVERGIARKHYCVFHLTTQKLVGGLWS